MIKIRAVAAGILAALAVAALTACTTEPKKSSGDQIAQQRANYAPKNDVEGKNYNARQKLADSPATLVWCTAYPTSPNAKAFTVPIVGKLTSGNKRPYPTSREIVDTDTGGLEYNPEVAGPDGMYGTSGEYRYGFDPAGNYHDFYNLETYCTNVPTVVQKETTVLSIGSGADPAQLDAKVEQALKACQVKNPDQTARCDEAARLLGVG